MNTEDIVTELTKMSSVGDGLYSLKINTMIKKLNDGYYKDLDQLMSSDELIYDLNSIGFPDLAKKLLGRGNYGRYWNDFWRI